MLLWHQAAPKHHHPYQKVKIYEEWLKLIKVWRCFTDLPANRQGSTLVLSLEDEALDSVLEIDDVDIAKENGVDGITESLNRLLKKDSTITKYQTFEAFETFKRSATMSIQAFLNNLKRLYKTKSYGTVQSENILAYRFLKSANSSNNHKELIKATIPELKYDLMKYQLNKTFNDASRHIPTKNEEVIKAEDF